MTPEQKIEALQAELSNAKDFIWYLRSFLDESHCAVARVADEGAVASYNRIEALLKRTGAKI